MNLFVYGTLRDLPLLRAVGGCDFQLSEAVLHGYAVMTMPGDVVPMITAHDGAQAKGLLVRDVTDAARARFDLYESAWGYAASEVTVQTNVGQVVAQVYLPPNDQKGGADPWSLKAWQAQNGVAAAQAAQEIFERNPWPTPAALRVILPMAEKRAWAQIRAAERQAPATVRADHDVRHARSVATIQASQPVQGQFFAMRAQNVSHQRFDGGMNADLPREVFIGIDAALVLPYDAVADTVLLVEQMRMGPLVLGDANPWTLEPVAGMVDARETPEAAALREAQEEAGLTDLALEQMFSFYASPGSSTDYFYCYLGQANLGAPRTYFGGLEDEHEDLRLHILTYETAIGLAQSGEITAGPLLTMLYWLAANRARLRV